MPAAPRSLAFIKVDTLGDLVLFAPTLAAVHNAWPATRIVTVIRRAYAGLARQLVPGVEWLTTTLDPFARGPGADAEELKRLGAALAAVAPDVLVAATSRRNWLEIALAAQSPAPRRIASGGPADDEFFSTQLRVALGVDTSKAFTEHAPAGPADAADWQRDFSLADALLGMPVRRERPQLELDAATRASVREQLAGRSLVPGSYVACAAAGFANVSLKTWPAERFAAVLRDVKERHGLPALLIGHESERAHLETVAKAAGAGAALWLGNDDTLPQLAALIADAALFIGNDTGAMHLAAAVDVPVVAVFGGGTWPRFVPAARRSVSVVQPLPCFGCGWDCAFGDAPCIGLIEAADVNAAVDFALANRMRDFAEIQRLEKLPESARMMMGKAAARHRETSAGHLARQHKLEELTALDREKDAEIASLKDVCNEREKTIFVLDGHVRNLQAHTATLEADKAVLEKTIRELPTDSAGAARALADQAVHIRNIEALLIIREREKTELLTTIENQGAGLHDLEQAKHYGRLLAEKERTIRELRQVCDEHEATIRELSANATSATAKAGKLWGGARSIARDKAVRPLDRWLFKTVVERHWMQIGILRQHAPKPLRWDKGLPGPRMPDAALPQIGIVTPSYGQERFVERTMLSILDQHYPKLRYVVQDGGSKDNSAAIIERHASRLAHWESVKDKGQADAISRGFGAIAGELGPDDLMAWLNSDDLLGPGVLRFVAEYFARNPGVDVVYGHRIIIDENDQDVGRWVMPRHDPETLEWIDYVPQETLFWRKKAWDIAGGIDPSFQFALDWDLLARFHQARCRIVRLPYFLGAFRVHNEQKTSQAIHTIGADEMRRIRTRFHGERQDDPVSIDRYARRTRFRGALCSRLLELGIRW